MSGFNPFGGITGGSGFLSKLGYALFDPAGLTKKPDVPAPPTPPAAPSVPSLANADASAQQQTDAVRKRMGAASTVFAGANASSATPNVGTRNLLGY